MSPLPTKTGPGGTEFLARSSALGTKAVQSGKPAVAAAPESSAGHLRQAVEQARREGAREKLELALHQRQQFWMDTCREVREMRAACRQGLELHRQQGCRFWVPSPHQVQYILEALDSALPGWDRDHPALFHRTLELNFPELLRVGRALRRN